MPVIPEIILQKAIIRGFENVKKDPRLFDVLFKNFSQTLLSELKQFVLNTPIELAVNYPRGQQLNLPSIVMLLRSENESETFLGDMLGWSSADDDIPDEDMVIDGLSGSAGSVSTLSGLPPTIASGLAVEGSEGVRVTIAESSLNEDFAEVVSLVQAGKCVKLYVVQGTGIGQVETVVSASNNSLDTDSIFEVQLDSTSVVDIRDADENCLIEGEPTKVYDKAGFYQRKGVNYEVQYQLQIVAGHQEQVIYLYSIVKALLLAQRPFLEQNGIQAFKLSGSDFAPRSEYLPSEAFARALNIQFTYLFSFIEEFNAPGQIDLCLTPDELGFAGTGETFSIGSFIIE